jgi:hypothetical protein
MWSNILQSIVIAGLIFFFITKQYQFETTYQNNYKELTVKISSLENVAASKETVHELKVNLNQAIIFQII